MALVAGGGGGGAIESQHLPTAILSQLLPPVRLRVAAPHSSDDDERAPLIPPGSPASSTTNSSDPAPTTSSPAATGAKRWRPFGRVGDVFSTWPKQGHGEPHADIDIEMAFPHAASFPNPVVSSMLKANSAPPLWANGRKGDGRSSVTRAYGQTGQSAAESVMSARTPSVSVVRSGTASGQGPTTDWMKKFKGLLVAYVFFALPIILFFFPRYDKNHSHPVLQNLMDNSKVDFEKAFILVLFVIHVTAGVLGVLLAHIAQGPMATRAVGVFTLLIITSILGFMDYILMKTMPENLRTTLIFLAHFIIRVTIILFLWFKYVWPSRCCQGRTRED